MNDLIDVKRFVTENYSIPSILHIFRDTIGSGDNYIIQTVSHSYFLKLFSVNNKKYRIYDEIRVCQFLNATEPITSEFIINNSGTYITYFKNTIYGHLQLLFESDSWTQFNVSDENIKKGILFLGKIDKTLLNFNLPVNNLFLNIHQDYELSKKVIGFQKFSCDKDSSQLIDKRKTYLSDIPNLQLSRFTYLTSHADYTPMQLLIRNDDIYKVIDFSHVSTVPIVWEVVRYYSNCVLAKDFNMNDIYALLDIFSTIIPLSSYDYQNAGYLFALQILQSAYGFKEYAATKESRYLDVIQNRDLYLQTLLN